MTSKLSPTPEPGGVSQHPFTKMIRARDAGSIANKRQPEELIDKISKVRGAALELLEALQEVQPFVNGWQGSDEGRAIAMRVNAAIFKATGREYGA